MGFLVKNIETTPQSPSSGQSMQMTLSSDKRPREITDDQVVHILSQQHRNNYLRNSGFWFAQRQTPGTLTTYSNTTGRTFTADGWAITNENTSTQYRRVDTASGPESGLQSQYYGEYTKITTTGKILVSQCLEGKEVMSLRGRTARFQCWLKAIIGTPITLKLSVIQLNSAGTIDTIPATFVSAFGGNGVDPTLGTNLAYLSPKSGITPDNATVQTNNVTCSVTTTWQRYGFLVDIPANCKNIIVMVHSDNQIIATNGFAIGQASLTDGYETQDWNPKDQETELNRVQRFYVKTFQVDIGPAQNAGLLGALRFPAVIAGAVATSLNGARWVFPVRTRNSGSTSVSTYNPSAANAFARNATGSTDATATALANSSETGADITATGIAGWVVGDDIRVHATYDVEL